MKRTADITRQTSETDIVIELCVDGEGEYDIDTGIGFFDHMLEGFARHGFFDLLVRVHGDTEVDSHHTVEDTGIALGQAFKQALGSKEGIKRFGHFTLPMDDALVCCALDFSGRPYLEFSAELTTPMLGTMETETVREFFLGFVNGASINLHIVQLSGQNTHHIIEAMFKAFAKALRMAVKRDIYNFNLPSTKGIL